MDVVRVVIINRSRLQDDDVVDGVTALQKQVSDDFAPRWQVDAALLPVGRTVSKTFPGHWAVVLIDESRSPRDGETPSTGYRDLTRDGLPLTVVRVDRVREGQDWTHAASRALLEMLADPDCSATAFHHPNAARRVFYAVDVCSPVAAYTDGYASADRWVADFTYRAYWEPRARERSSDATFDERRLLGGPLEVRPGGSIGAYDVATATWFTSGALPEPGSRLEKRTTSFDRWDVSRWLPDGHTYGSLENICPP